MLRGLLISPVSDAVRSLCNQVQVEMKRPPSGFLLLLLLTIIRCPDVDVNYL